MDCSVFCGHPVSLSNYTMIILSFVMRQSKILQHIFSITDKPLWLTVEYASAIKRLLQSCSISYGHNVYIAAQNVILARPISRGFSRHRRKLSSRRVVPAVLAVGRCRWDGRLRCRHPRVDDELGGPLALLDRRVSPVEPLAVEKERHGDGDDDDDGAQEDDQERPPWETWAEDWRS